jgi:hypothetical protein
MQCSTAIQFGTQDKNSDVGGFRLIVDRNLIIITEKSLRESILHYQKSC